MFTTIIAGIDGREGGRDAVALARALGGEDTRLVLVLAYPVREGFPGGHVSSEVARALREQAVATLEGHRPVGVAGEIVAVPDQSPARALQSAAIAHDADLLVVGSAHHGPVARLVLGSVGRSLLQGAPCPVAVAPRGLADAGVELRRMAVGYDGGPEAEAALTLAAALADAHGAALTCSSAWDLPAAAMASPYYSPDLDRLADAIERETRERVETALASYPGAVSEIRRGAARGVLEEASEAADLLVVGSRGWGPVHRVALGSTSDHLVHHAHCPVLVVPRPAGAPEPSSVSEADAVNAG
jgi:nucleotide-binding universal stress UspA family protein